MVVRGFEVMGVTVALMMSKTRLGTSQGCRRLRNAFLAGASPSF